MKLYYHFKKKYLLFIAPVFLLMLGSCSSYQYSGYENDGIYGNTNRSYSEPNQTRPQASNTDDNYYSSIFAEESALYGEILAEGAIFTDVDSYSSTGNYEDPYLDNQSNYQGNAPWGNDPDQYTVNIYNHGFGGGFWNPYWGGGIFAFDPFFDPFFGPAWGPGVWGPGYWGPGRMFGPRWGGHWGMGMAGFGFGGYGFGFGHPFFYGGGLWQQNNFYGNYYNRNNVAYNTGRRGANSSYNRAESLRNATSLDGRRNSTYSRSIRNVRSSNGTYGTTRQRIGSDSRVRSNVPYSTRNRTNTINRSNQRQSSGVYQRSSAPTRSNNTGTMRSSSPSRSSGTMRSSGSSGRSSGGGAVRSSGGGGGRSSRGN